MYWKMVQLIAENPENRTAGRLRNGGQFGPGKDAPFDVAIEGQDIGAGRFAAAHVTRVINAGSAGRGKAGPRGGGSIGLARYDPVESKFGLRRIPG